MRSWALLLLQEMVQRVLGRWVRRGEEAPPQQNALARGGGKRKGTRDGRGGRYLDCIIFGQNESQILMGNHEKVRNLKTKNVLVINTAYCI